MSFPNRDGEGDLFSRAVNPDTERERGVHSGLCHSVNNGHVIIELYDKGTFEKPGSPKEGKRATDTPPCSHAILGQNLTLGAVISYPNTAPLVHAV